MIQTYSLQWNIWVELPKLDQIIAILGQREIPKVRESIKIGPKNSVQEYKGLGLEIWYLHPLTLNEGLYQVLMQG